MKQKYTVIKDIDNDQLKIREYAELDKESLSLLCEESYVYSAIEAAARKGEDALVGAIRTHNLFPPSNYAKALAETVKILLGSSESESMIFFNDIETLAKISDEAVLELDDVDDESGDIDDLLEDDVDEDFDDDMEITNINSSIKIADDDAVEIEEEP
jgi:hypothetical protein